MGGGSKSEGLVVGTLTLLEVCAAVGGACPAGWGDPFGNAGVCRVSTDSRNVGPGVLFFALAGERFDAHDFVGQVAAAGSWGAVVSHPVGSPELPDGCGGFRQIVVDDVLEAFGRFARFLLEKRAAMPRPFTTFAITGSNGKTTTKEILASILTGSGISVLKTSGNHNNLVGLPLTVSELRTDHDAVVLEMGTNAPGEIARLVWMANPDVGILTGIGAAHLERFGTLEGVAAAKGELFGNPALKMHKVIMPSAVRMYYPQLPEGISFDFVAGPDDGPVSDGQMAVSDIDVSFDGVAFSLSLDGIFARVGVPLSGAHNAMNFALAFDAYRSTFADSDLGMPGQLRLAAQYVRNCLELPSGRMEHWTACGGAVLLHDAYNANPTSMAGALDFIGRVASPERRILVLGMMGELGAAGPDAHRGIGRLVASIGARLLLCVGGLASLIGEAAVANGFPKNDVMFVGNGDGPTTDTGQLNAGLEWLRNRGINSDDVFLIKGSRSVRLERVLDYFDASPVGRNTYVPSMA